MGEAWQDIGAAGAFASGPPLLRQRTGWTRLHTLGTGGARARIAPRRVQIGHHHGMNTASLDRPGMGPFHLPARPRTAGTQDTAIGIVQEPVMRGINAVAGKPIRIAHMGNP